MEFTPLRVSHAMHESVPYASLVPILAAAATLSYDSTYYDDLQETAERFSFKKKYLNTCSR